jgi:ribose 5-phosphate isomerase A
MTADAQKKAAALAALELVQPGMKLGLGTGSTAAHFIVGLGEKVKAGLDVKCVPTSKATRALAEQHGIPLMNLEDEAFVDLTVDGADEFDADFNLIKGGGGALLREKIVATSSRRMVVIADESKRVKKIGRFPLPVEVIPFGVKATGMKIDRAFKLMNVNAKLMLRASGDKPFVTDGGHFIIDCMLDSLPNPKQAESILCGLPGVVETGLFIGICSQVYMGTSRGVETLTRK